MKESETKERLEEYAPLGVLAPVVQKLDSAIYLFNNWDLVISRDLIPPVCPSQIKKEIQCKILLYQSATAEHSACQGNSFRLYLLHVHMTLIEESADFESRRC